MRWGKGPKKPFEERSKILMKVRFPREGDIWPTKPRPLRSTLATRPGYLELHIRPFQLQKGVVLFQDIKAPPGSLMVCLKWYIVNISVEFPWTVEDWIIRVPKDNSKNNANGRTILFFISSMVYTITRMPF